MTSPTDAQIAEMRRLAADATPGPWHSKQSWVDADTSLLGNVAVTTRGNDAAYIAAANPQAVLALLDALQAAREAIDRARSQLRSLPASATAVAVDDTLCAALPHADPRGEG